MTTALGAGATDSVSPETACAVLLRLADRLGSDLTNDEIALCVAARYFESKPPAIESQQLGEALRARGVDTAELVRLVGEMLNVYPAAADPERPRARLGPDGRFHPALPALRFQGPADLVATAGEVVAWLVAGLIAMGALALLAGAPKAGKTEWLLALLAAILRGESIAGRRAERSPVVMLSEERPATLRPRLERWGGSGTGPASPST